MFSPADTERLRNAGDGNAKSAQLGLTLHQPGNDPEAGGGSGASQAASTLFKMHNS